MKNKFKTLYIMKLFFLAFSFSLLAFSSCTKSYKYESSGVITGQDGRYCACCGGWFIEIDNTTHRFDNIPENSNIDLENPTYPIEVELNWKPKDVQCMGDEIVVEEIVRR